MLMPASRFSQVVAFFWTVNFMGCHLSCVQGVEYINALIGEILANVVQCDPFF